MTRGLLCHIATALAAFLFLTGFTVQTTASDVVKKFTITGTITDSGTGEGLAGATVFVRELKNGTATSPDGNYTLSLPEGTYTLVFSFIGYTSVEKTLTLTGNVHLDIQLNPSTETLKEVEVTGEKADQNVARAEMSSFTMNIKTIEKIPALFGEVDILKAIQLLPGVQAVSEGSSGFSVRGGAPDQNLILLDQAAVYNASHLLGFFSVFNNDAVKDVKLFKGDIPAEYGGRLASVLDVREQTGDLEKYHLSGGIGLISSRLSAEGPIIKDKASFLVAGRRTYADLYLPLAKEENIRKNKLYFYDLNAKVLFRINDKNQVLLSGYYGRDVFKNPYAYTNWGNSTASLRWNTLLGQKVIGNFSLLWSGYDYRLGTPSGSADSFEWTSRINDIGFHGDINFFPDPKNTLQGGLSVTYHMIDPGQSKGTGEESAYGDFAVPMNYSVESAAYLSNEQKIGEHVTLKYGLRFSLFQNIGPGTVYRFDSTYTATDSVVYASGDIYHTYQGLEPRLGILYRINERNSLKASYSLTKQYLQLAQNSTAGTPMDVWFPASPNIKPQVANQVALGYFRNFLQNRLETSVEAFYKKMDNVIDFKDNAQLLLNPELEGEVRVGKGYAYGAELLVKMNVKSLSGWVSYTYSRCFREIPGINEGEKYPAPFDKPNTVSVVLNYTLSKRMELSANFVYATGSPVTFPTGRAEVGNEIIAIYSDRNQYRYPDYHRLDLSYTLKGKEKPGKKFSWDLNVSIYNVYNRKNTWTINFVQDSTDPNVTYAEKVYLFGIIPSATFNFHL